MAIIGLLLNLMLMKVCLSYGDSVEGCCYKKENNGINYILVNEEDTSEFHCDSNCVYEKESEHGSKFCFKNGGSPSSCLNKLSPIKTQFVREEGNETIVQENHFHNDTGILMLTVPPHKNYTESVFMFHQESHAHMVKTGGICQLSDLPDHYNVSAMAEGFERHHGMTRVKQSDVITNYVLKTRVAKLGARKRAELHRDVGNLCKEHAIVKTNDFQVDEADWEKYNRGEIVLFENKERSPRSCNTAKSCSKQGPDACNAGGWGWKNPDSPNQGFSYHEVSSGSICVTCLLSNSTDCSATNLCECADITDIRSLTSCAVADHIVGSTFREGGKPFTQEMIFSTEYTEGQAVSIISPVISYTQENALTYYEGVEIIMNSHKEGWWHNNQFHTQTLENNQLVKVRDTCNIRTLPNNIFPVDWAIDINHISAGNNEGTDPEDEIIQYVVLYLTRPLTDPEINNLHPLIKKECTSPIHKFEEYTILKTEASHLLLGGTIYLPGTGTQNLIKVKRGDQGMGSWRQPNIVDDSNNDVLWINVIVIPVIDA